MSRRDPSRPDEGPERLPPGAGPRRRAVLGSVLAGLGALLAGAGRLVGPAVPPAPPPPRRKRPSIWLGH
jgi:hypothetical protein